MISILKSVIFHGCDEKNQRVLKIDWIYIDSPPSTSRMESSEMFFNDSTPIHHHSPLHPRHDPYDL